MEDPKLVDYFKTAVQKAEEQGYDKKTIHASMHEASPKRVWQEKAYLFLVDGAVVNYAIFSLVLIYFGSTFMNDTTTLYIFAFLLLFPAGVLYYFAHGAFEFHAGKKLLMSFITSVVLSGVAWFMYSALDKIVKPLMDKLTSSIETIGNVNAVIPPGMDVPAMDAVNQGSQMLMMYGNRIDISIPAIIIVILLAYNFIPLLFYFKEKIVDNHALKVEKKTEQN